MPSKPSTALGTAIATPDTRAAAGHGAAQADSVPAPNTQVKAPAATAETFPPAPAPRVGPPEFPAPAERPAERPEEARRAISPLTWRIVIINVVGLLIFVIGVLALNNFRAGLVDARITALGTEGEIIAGALVESALREPDIEGQTAYFDLDTAAPILRRLAETSGSRLRLYDYHGHLLLDSRNLLPGGQVQTYGLPPLGGLLGTWPWLTRLYDWVVGRLPAVDLPPYREIPGADASLYPEVTAALLGDETSAVRANDAGHVVVSVSVPVQRLKVVQGALLLSSEGPEIEDMLRAERLKIVQMFVVALGVSILLSVLVSGAIVRPIRRLAQAAVEVTVRRRGRTAIPTFGTRADEIGDLGRALARMTEDLYARLDAIESFAADVAHEIKNPLTSLRSAIETLERTPDEPRRGKLLAVIQDDVRRIDRLITDISAASRLDAELAREHMETVDIGALLKGLAAIANDHARDQAGPIEVTLDAGALDPSAFQVQGLEDRLGQVFRNIIDNARSFSPAGKPVQVSVKLGRGELRVTVDDEGPGIPPESLERVFERFYTSRDAAPDGKESFGKHSGLGLAIARQIILAHGGRIWAENRHDETGRITGARFVVALPRLAPR